VLSESPLPSFGGEGGHIDVTNIPELKRADSADYGQLDNRQTIILQASRIAEKNEDGQVFC
jgi:hypothetical protein